VEGLPEQPQEQLSDGAVSNLKPCDPSHAWRDRAGLNRKACRDGLAHVFYDLESVENGDRLRHLLSDRSERGLSHVLATD
jgi:hypothetical protein